MKKQAKLKVIQDVIEKLTEQKKLLQPELENEKQAIEDPPSSLKVQSEVVSYQAVALANSISKSIAEKEEEINILKRFAAQLNNGEFDGCEYVIIGSHVLIEVNKTFENYFILPVGSGIKVTIDGNDITCLSPTSPFGRSIISQRKDCIVDGRKIFNIS